MKPGKSARRAIAAALSVSLCLGSVDGALAQVRTVAVVPGETVPAARVQLGGSGSSALPNPSVALGAAALLLAPTSLRSLPLPSGRRAASAPAASKLSAAALAGADEKAGPAALDALAAAGRELASPRAEATGASDGTLRRLFIGKSSSAKSDDSAPAVPAVKRWAAAAMLGAALLAPASVSAGPEHASPPASVASAQATAPAARAVVTVRLESRSYAVADPVRVELSVVNKSGKPLAVPIAEVARALGAAAGPRFAVEEVKEGEVLVQPGQTAQITLELADVQLPADLAPGKKSDVRIPRFQVRAGEETLEVPAFGFELHSVLPEAKQGQKPPQLHGMSPWSERFYWDWWLLAGWAAGLGALVWSWKRWELE
ncbi:MAG: hypothetical protein HY925_07100, partial [Elusimicrobia bacterium]|nr:hypothetical protein [Elusimicrobiota bacterium]